MIVVYGRKRSIVDMIVQHGMVILVAWHPAYPEAVMRAKEAWGLRGWRGRSWRMFGGADPYIGDATDWLAALLEAHSQLGGVTPGLPLSGLIPLYVVVKPDGDATLEADELTPRVEGTVTRISIRPDWQQDLGAL